MEKTKYTTGLRLKRCPHCAVANPTILVQMQPHSIGRADGGPPQIWAGYGCTSCGGFISAQCQQDSQNVAWIIRLFPEPAAVDGNIPDPARTFLQQAHDTLHAPDAAAVMAGSAVDAMLKELAFVDGSVYHRIEQAVNANVLTKSMGEWAHSVRLGSNRPRHADSEKPHVSPEEAAQSVEFATALGQFLFVLTARVTRGIEKAKEAEAAANG